jgi:uncharacterized protein (TIGR03435 family)
LVGRLVTLGQLCDRLTSVVGAPIDAPPLAAALQQAFGLKLESATAPVATLVVDHMEKAPTAN